MTIEQINAEMARSIQRLSELLNEKRRLKNEA